MKRRTACLAALWLAAVPATASAPTSQEPPDAQLTPLTAEMVASDPVAAEARCRWFLTSLFDRYQLLTTYTGDGDAAHLHALEWARDAYLTLDRPNAAVRAAMEEEVELDRLYTDAFGPALPSGVPAHHPLYENDKPLCSGLLGVSAD